jgi:hypothetical protein
MTGWPLAKPQYHALTTNSYPSLFLPDVKWIKSIAAKYAKNSKELYSLHKKALELTVITEERGDGSGKEPNPNTARKPGTL